MKEISKGGRRMIWAALFFTGGKVIGFAEGE